MNTRYSNLFRFFFAFLDLLALNLVHAIVLAFFNKIPISAERNYLYLFVAANILWLFAAQITALYINSAAPNGDQFAKKTFRTFLVFNISLLLFIFIYHFPFSRLFMVCSFGAYLVYLLLTRSLLLGFTFYMEKGAKVKKKVVILGYNDVAKSLLAGFNAQRKNFLVAGFFEEEGVVDELSSHPIIGNLSECLEYAMKNNVQEIYSTISPERNAGLYEMAKVAEKSFIRFKFVPDFRLYVNRNTHMEYLADIPILSLRPEPLEDIGNAAKKRLFDLLFSMFVIGLVLSWLVPIIAILVKLSSKGPAFFVQMRSGKNNKQFRCFKFRTLQVNDEANLKQVTKDDNRITKLGRFLRKTNLDELPQFFNVLLGDMSIVGPRPHMLKHTSLFSKLTEEYMTRHFVKPGVTGWAQVNGYRGEIKEDYQLRKRIEYDIWYMENWSLWLDCKIICLTIYTTVKGDTNAY